MRTYILILHLRKDSKLRIGRLGTLSFRKGYYCYVGSASKGFENRVGRHSRLCAEKKGRPRWHIDHFLLNPNSSLMDVVELKGRNECQISRRIASIAAFSIDGFGSSDCKCRSHFHYFESRPNLNG
jgi:Uri superfamily endonuclease